MQARDGGPDHGPNSGASTLRVDGDPSARKNLLYLAAMELLCGGDINEPTFEAPMHAFGEAKHIIRVMASDPQLASACLGPPYADVVDADAVERGTRGEM